MLSNFNQDKVAEEPISFEDALDQVGTGKCQYKVIFAGGLTVMSAYMAVSGLSYAVTAAQCDLQLDSDRKATIISGLFLGIVISCHLWGFLSDTKGRRCILVRTLICDALLYVAISLTPYYPVIFVLRILSGITSSASLVCVISYISEFQKSNFRSLGVLISCIIGNCGFLCLSLLAYFIIPQKWEIDLLPFLVYKPWRLFIAVSGLPSFISWVLICFLPESPKFLLAADRKTEAIEVLRKIHSENNMKEEFKVKDILTNPNEKVAKHEPGSSKIGAFFILVWKQTVPLFKPPLRTNMLLVCLLNFLVFFSNNGVYLWLPESTNRVEVFKQKHGNQTAYFCEVIESYQMNVNATEAVSMKSFVFLEKGVSMETKCDDSVDTSVFLKTSIIGVFQVLCLVVVVILMKFLKRKIVMTAFILGSLLFCLSLLSSIYIEYMVEKMSLLVILMSGVFPVISSCVVDLFPTNVRSMASCLGQLSSRFATITAMQTVGAMIDYHCTNLIWLFVGSYIFSTAISILLPNRAKYLDEETKEKKSDEGSV